MTPRTMPLSLILGSWVKSWSNVPSITKNIQGKTGYVPFQRSLATQSSTFAASTRSNQLRSCPAFPPSIRGDAHSVSINRDLRDLLVLTNIGHIAAEIASRVSTPGVCHSNLPPLSTLRRTLTVSWQRHSRATLGIIHLAHWSEVCPSSTLLDALLYIPHPEMVTNSGAAIPPNAAATKAAG